MMYNICFHYLIPLKRIYLQKFSFFCCCFVKVFPVTLLKKKLPLKIGYLNRLSSKFCLKFFFLTYLGLIWLKFTSAMVTWLLDKQQRIAFLHELLVGQSWIPLGIILLVGKTVMADHSQKMQFNIHYVFSKTINLCYLEGKVDQQ